MLADVRYCLLSLLIVVTFSIGFQPVSFAQKATDYSASREHYPVLFKASFSKRHELKQWDSRPRSKYYTLARSGENNRVLHIKAKQVGNYLFTKSLPIDVVAGRKLLIRLRVRNEGISALPSFYNGVKIVLHFSSPAGEAYPQLHVPADPFDWQQLGFTPAIPPSATLCQLSIGLEQVSGKVSFDDVEIRLFPIEEDSVSVTGNVATMQEKKLQTLRGAMVPTFIDADDLRTLAGWGANHVRWQLTWNSFPHSPADTASLTSYKTWLRAALQHVHSLLPLCDLLGLHVLLDLHTLPGGYPFPGQENRLFRDTAMQEAFRAIWKEIATQFRDAPGLWGYDLANEPAEGYLPDGVMDWRNLAAATAADIRAIDTVHYIVVEASPYGSWLGLLSLRPLAGINKCIYSFHTYDPLTFTHQGVDGNRTGIKYPGIIDGHYWDSTVMRNFLQPIRDWQLRHNVSIYVGEFSAARWAPDSSAYNYLRDCINIFESWGWSWDYHAFREWDGWSVEHDKDPNHHERTAEPTDRQMLLMQEFSKNQKTQ